MTAGHVAELAARTGTNERLVREWLEQQGATELLDATATADESAFALPPDTPPCCSTRRPRRRRRHGHVPRRTTSPRCRGRWSRSAPAYGIPYADYGPTRPRVSDRHPAGLPAEVASWLAAVPPSRSGSSGRPRARHRLRRRLVERQHGTAHPGLVARRRPRPRLDRGGQAGRRVRARRGPGAVRAPRRRHAGRGGLDLATMFEMLHDLARPVEALRALGRPWPGRRRTRRRRAVGDAYAGRPTSRSDATTATASSHATCGDRSPRRRRHARGPYLPVGSLVIGVAAVVGSAWWGGQSHDAVAVGLAAVGPCGSGGGGGSAGWRVAALDSRSRRPRWSWRSRWGFGRRVLRPRSRTWICRRGRRG